MTEPSLRGDWHYPVPIQAGAGQLAALPACCQQLGIQAPLLVTDPALVSLPMVPQALEYCHLAALRGGLFSTIKANPDGEDVMAGVKAFNAGQHDGIIALGGGAALDAGKAIALMAGQSRPIWAFEDINDNWRKADAAVIRPVVAIPTTAGTGSEVGRAAVIVDPAGPVKKIIFHPGLQPSRVILDPELTLSLPPTITAATGMDALAHSLEALCAPGYHPMADGIALEAIRLINRWLPVAVSQGDHLEARMQLLTASTMGATAFQKGLGAMHALAHPLGALYNCHHGLLNAILMPYVLNANRQAISNRLTDLARYLALDGVGFEGVLNWVLALRNQLGIPPTLAEIGLNDDDAERVGQMAVADPSAATNPLPLTAADYRALFRAAIRGDLRPTE